MRGRWRAITMAAATLAVFLGVHASGAQQAPGAKSTSPAAKVEDEVITLEEVEQGLRAPDGRQQVGAQPVTAFQKLIDSELARKASR